MKEILANFWAKCVEYYGIYSDFIHSILKDELGDLAVYVINIAVVSVIIIFVAKSAFSSHNSGSSDL